MISRIIKSSFKIIIAVGLIAIICISGTVFATGYFARDISYKKVDGTQINVETALNELYNKGDSNIFVATLSGNISSRNELVIINR